MSTIKHFRDLEVYRGALELALRISELTKKFPAEEKYSLSDQVRRSSRSVCANIGEAWRKRRYRAAFIAKLNDAEAEAAETQVHAELAHRLGYLSQAEFRSIDDSCDKIIGQLVRMLASPEKWVIGSRKNT